MAYNHAQAEAEWKREEHARVMKMRKAGMSKEDILTIVVYDRSVFNSNRRFESHLDDSEIDIENAADCEVFGEFHTVEQMVGEIEDFTLHQIVAEADEFTLQILLMKAQGYSTRDICLHFGVDKGVVYGRIRRLRNKIVNKL